jgi:hypothetical protein
MRAERAQGVRGSTTRTLPGGLPVPRGPPSELPDRHHLGVIPSLEVATFSPLHRDQKRLPLSSGHHRARGLQRPLHPSTRAIAPMDHDQGFRTLDHDQEEMSLSFWNSIDRGFRAPDHDRRFGPEPTKRRFRSPFGFPATRRSALLDPRGTGEE